MEKKTKMWVVVVVLTLVVGGIFYFWVESTTYDGAPEYEYDVELEVFENQTAWIINVTRIDMYDPYGDEIIENTRLMKPEVHLKIIRKVNSNTKTWWPIVSYLDYKPEEYGVEFVDLDKDGRFSVGDKFIFNKSGGTEYQPKEGDLICVDVDVPNIIMVSNTIIL